MRGFGVVVAAGRGLPVRSAKRCVEHVAKLKATGEMAARDGPFLDERAHRGIFAFGRKGRDQAPDSQLAKQRGDRGGIVAAINRR